MILLVRDEDVPTVASVLTAIAVQRGLEPAEAGEDLLSMAAMLLGPHVVLGAGEDFVVASNLESLPIDDPDEVASAISSACGTEVVAIGYTASGIRVAVFEDGERDEEVRVDVDASGTTRSAALAEIAPSEDAAEAFARGVAATNAVELAHQVLLLFGGDTEGLANEPTTLAFREA